MKPEFYESNYKYLKTIASNNAHIADSGTNPTTIAPTTLSSSTMYRTEIELPLRTDKKGVYLVFRDQGACVSLLSIKVYYTVCSAQVNNLIMFPETPTGSNATDLVQQPGVCIDNSDITSGTIPYAYCQTNGNWFITNENGICLCRPGYYFTALPQAQCIGK